jgi:hypothetical protein
MLSDIVAKMRYEELVAEIDKKKLANKKRMERKRMESKIKKLEMELKALKGENK